MQWEIRDDVETIKNVLTEAGLPATDIGTKIKFIVALNESDRVIGCIGVEPYGDGGLLRSFAVDPVYRNRGIGRELLYRLFSLSRQYGINNLHLLTTTAEKFFSRTGFSIGVREDAPASIRSTTEFSSLCPSTSAYMVMRSIQNFEYEFGAADALPPVNENKKTTK